MSNRIDFGHKARLTDPATGGQKENSQARFSAIPKDALAEVARVYGYGEEKYPDVTGVPNYLRGMPWRWNVDAALRHISSWEVGEDRDEESELHHLAQAIWHLLTLITYQKRELGTDNRLKVMVDHQPPSDPSDYDPMQTALGYDFDVELLLAMDELGINGDSPNDGFPKTWTDEDFEEAKGRDDREHAQTSAPPASRESLSPETTEAIWKGLMKLSQAIWQLAQQDKLSKERARKAAILANVAADLFDVALHPLKVAR